MADVKNASLLSPLVRDYAEHTVWKLAVHLLAHPAFDDVLVDYAFSVSEPTKMEMPFNKLFSQKLRYITCYLLIGNYTRFVRDPATQPAPTLGALQKIAPASARQVSGFVSALRHGGYVAVTPSDRDRRVKILKPELNLLKEVARSPLAFLQAAERLLIPTHSALPALSEDSEALADLMGRSSERYSHQDVLFSPFKTIVYFTERDCGYLLLSTIIASYLANTLKPGRSQVSLTYDALASRLQISRQHVGNLLVEAARKGWFSVAPGGRLAEVSPNLLDEYRTWAAGQMAHYFSLAHASA